jgi:hypothetical protein
LAQIGGGVEPESSIGGFSRKDWPFPSRVVVFSHRVTFRIPSKILIQRHLQLDNEVLLTWQRMEMRRLTLTALVALLAMTSFAQQGPWSEQPPLQPPSNQGGMPPQGRGPGPQPPPQGQMDTDGNAPDRGVARISSMNGNVSVRRGDSGDLVGGILNAPLIAGDRVVTADAARGEVEFDSGNLIRLGPATEVRLSELQYGHYQIQLATGTTIFRVRREGADVEISTPSIAVHPMAVGVYRVTVRTDGTTEITVRTGNAEVSGPRGSEPLQAGSMMMVRGTATDPEFQTVQALPEDDFERWSMGRDQQMDRSRSPQHVNRDVTGAEDLDQYGHWANDGSYGQVWVPTADPGWAPYRCGRWVWMDYYGWTWVGCEPWAWAPYHYGRWYFGSLGWAWWPGPMYGPAYFRPALVGFFGWGGGIGIGVGFGFGNVGWVPLAPFERYRPWYGPGARGAGVVGNVNVASIYRNARVANGVTSMQARDFGRGGVNNANFVRSAPGDLARAGAVRGGLPMSPSAESRNFSGRAASSQGLPRTGDNTRFFSKASSTSRGSANSNGGWQRFNPSTNAGQGSRASGGSPQNSGGGWQRMEGANRGAAATTAGQQGYAQRTSQQQVRISPSIVQNRGVQSGSGQNGGNGSGNGRSAGGSRSGGSRGTGGGSRR